MGINRGYTNLDIKKWEGKKYYDDIRLSDNEYTFSFYKDYYSKVYQDKMISNYNYNGVVILNKNSTQNKKTLIITYEKLDGYIEFAAKNMIRVNGDIYLDIENDGYINRDKDIKIGDRFIYLVVVPFLILFVFNLPCIFITMLACLWALI